MSGKKIYAVILSVVLATGMLSQAKVDAYATQSAAAKYSRSYVLSGNKAADIVAVATAQKGKTKASLGYSEAWCADFISDCAYLSGASDVIPANGSVAGLYQKLLDSNVTEVFTPQAGDLVFYYCTVTNSWVHCGIMINSLQSIEGNYSGKVSLVNGVYKDSHGHSLAAGTVIRKFFRPAYNKSVAAPPKTVSNNPSAGGALNSDTASAGTADDTDTKSASGSSSSSSTGSTGSSASKKTATTTTTTKTTTTTTKSTSLKLYTKYAGTYKVNTKEDPLIMREKPDKTSGILTSVPKGTKVKVTKASGTKKTDWAYVTYKSFKGYLSMQYLKKVTK
ncbi:MAG: SH3 domain-containing protein [Candidatus Weimeria sp.]